MLDDFSGGRSAIRGLSSCHSLRKMAGLRNVISIPGNAKVLTTILTWQRCMILVLSATTLLGHLKSKLIARMLHNVYVYKIHII